MSDSTLFHFLGRRRTISEGGHLNKAGHEFAPFTQIAYSSRAFSEYSVFDVLLIDFLFSASRFIDNTFTEHFLIFIYWGSIFLFLPKRQINGSWQQWLMNKYEEWEFSQGWKSIKYLRGLRKVFSPNLVLYRPGDRLTFSITISRFYRKPEGNVAVLQCFFAKMSILRIEPIYLGFWIISFWMIWCRYRKNENKVTIILEQKQKTSKV